MESKIPNKERPLILVAEDDESNFKLIKAIINNRCDVLWARNGQEMLNLYEQHGEQADVLLMDLKMPLMDGLEATRIIRQSSPDIPIIVQTAYAFYEDQQQAMVAGATEVLVKPITLMALRNSLKKYVPGLTW
ncbi:MAG: response regulator [Bacteroides graminisolvens]|jgi:CheY-like chemotaxis protein|uniref:Two-component system sensor histidine kinase n=2 Tax=Bacteroides graminisolvens TaxID=477666 RepID=A0A069D2C8_9BACE|nr:response regulator [Bacteroides graminisolvens]MBP6980392.1 response regulator [Bacteroides sp.]MBP7294352.1 response regulator [Bacteroides sp.]MCD8474372.1 response regulator [Bacteroides graminisolvens]MCD8495764.1 response regulator [Bacteroides graminisolvens]MCD8572809.1 response regulator [Bacteroides graminisolvens]